MNTIVLCECGEEAVANNGNSHDDYRCSHCGTFYAVKYKYQRHRDKIIGVDKQLRKNHREWRDRKFLGFW